MVGIFQLDSTSRSVDTVVIKISLFTEDRHCLCCLCAAVCGHGCKFAYKKRSGGNGRGAIAQKTLKKVRPLFVPELRLPSFSAFEGPILHQKTCVYQGVLRPLLH